MVVLSSELASYLKGEDRLASLVAQLIKNRPVIQKTPVQFLGWKDLLEKGMATHSSVFAWSIPTVRGAWWATVHAVAKSQT